MSASERETKFFNSASIAGASECWQWLGAKQSGVYGGFTQQRDGKKERILAHRFAKELALGRRLSSEENLHHACENTLCVNPRHLLIVARSEHQSHHRITHCKRGHELSGENLKVNAMGHYTCLTCRRERDSRRRKERRLTDPAWREKQRQRMLEYHARKRDVSK